VDKCKPLASGIMFLVSGYAVDAVLHDEQMWAGAYTRSHFCST